jgi:hypothetical protein
VYRGWWPGARRSPAPAFISARHSRGAFYVWIVCFVVTLAVSVVTRPRAVDDLKGRVYSITPRTQESPLPGYHRPVTPAAIVRVMATASNVVFPWGVVRLVMLAPGPESRALNPESRSIPLAPAENRVLRLVG